MSLRSTSHEPAQCAHECAKVRRSRLRGRVDPEHVEALVGVSDDVAKACGALESVRQLAVEVTRPGQPPEGFGVRRRRAKLEVQTSGGRQVDGDLRRLPQVQDHGIRGVGRGREARWVGRQSRGDTRQMTLDGGRLLGERLPIETTQRESSSSTPS